VSEPKVLSVLAVKGGVGKTTLAINLAGWVALQGRSVAVLDADRNRGAMLYTTRSGGAGGQPLPFQVFPISRYRSALAAAGDLLIIDGQASPDLAELKELASDSDRVLLPATPQKVSLLLACEVAEVLRSIDCDFRVCLTKCDSRQFRAVESAVEFLEGEGLPLLSGRTTLLSAYEQAESAGTLVGEATTDRGTRNPRSGIAWGEIVTIAEAVTDGLL
jgi:chromosome partitioning protein